MRTLVLNAGYEPLAVVSFRRALVLVMNGKATVLETDGEHPVFGIDDRWDRPSVIVRHPHIAAGAADATRGAAARRSPLRLLRSVGVDDRPRHAAIAGRRRLVGEPGGVLPALQQREG